MKFFERTAAARCRVLGHRRWYYDEEETGDFVFGCCRCKDPALVTDRLPMKELEAKQDEYGRVLVPTGFFDRMIARLEMLT